MVDITTTLSFPRRREPIRDLKWHGVMDSRLRGNDSCVFLRTLLAALTTAFALTLLPELSHAQSYPTRAIRLIVPQAAGSASDTVARIVAGELSRLLGQQIVVDNRPGGALTIGIDMVVKAPADGYTLGYAPIGAPADRSINMVTQ